MTNNKTLFSGMWLLEDM